MAEELNPTQIKTIITFNENCEYQSSSIEKKINLPQQKVTVNLKIVNTESNRNNINYYNDIIKATATVTYIDKEDNTTNTPVKSGRIEFYYITNNGRKIIINKNIDGYDTCTVNNKGQASVLFRPIDSCTIYARYIDDNNIYITEGNEPSQSITLSEIPTQITYTNAPPYITNVHDEVTIEVEVKNSITNELINYGTVTFLHYQKTTDVYDNIKEVPRVIGNPVPVINGKASITYIPIQTDDYNYTNPDNDTESQRLEEDIEVEYIRAFYNYSGEFIQDTQKRQYIWKYYQTSSAFTRINVCARNSITINQINNISRNNNPIETNNHIYECVENEQIQIIATILDKNGDQVIFKNKDTNTNLYFHIEGYHPHPKTKHNPVQPPKIYDDEYIQIMSEFNFLKVNYMEERQSTYENGFFKATFNLLPGYYTITAYSEMLTDLGDDTNNIDDNKIYAPVTESNIIYISSNYADITQNYSITVTGSLTTTKEIKNLTGTVNGLTNKQKEILNGETCYFYIPSKHDSNKIDTRTYEGHLEYNENNNTLIGKLNTSATTLNDEEYENENKIKIDIYGTHQVYMYIDSGIYTDTPNKKSYHHHTNTVDTTNDGAYDFYMPFFLSAPLSLSLIKDIELTLELNKTKAIVGEEILYLLTGENISSETNVTIYKRENQSILSTKLYEYAPIDGGTFTINEIGQYNIVAKKGQIQSNIIDINIIQDKIVPRLLESSKKIFASESNIIGVYLTTQTDVNITYAFLKAKLINQTTNEETVLTIAEHEKINDTTTYVGFKSNIYKEGKWSLKLEYDYDSSYNNQPIEKGTWTLKTINSVLYTPKITLSPYGGHYVVSISNNDKIKKDSYIISKITFMKGNNELKTGLYIHNIFKNNNIRKINEEWWNQWTSIKFEFEPYYDADNELHTILNTNEAPYESLMNLIGDNKEYNYLFDFTDGTQTTEIYEQIQTHKHSIFDIYGEYINENAINKARPNPQ